MSIQNFLFLLYHFSVGVFQKHKLKWSLTILALAASVSLITAVEIINRSAINEMERSTNLLNGFADINLVSTDGEFDEDVFNKLIADKNRLKIVAASPILTYQNRTDKLDNRFQILGIDIFRAPSTTPVFFQGIRNLSDRDTETQNSNSFINLLSENSVIVSLDIFENHSLQDNKLVLNTQYGFENLVPISIIDSKHFDRLVIMDIGNLQTTVNKPRKLNRIDIRIDPNSELEEIKVRLNKFLKTNQLDRKIRITDPSTRVTEISQLSSAYRKNLFVLGIATLFVTFFLLFSIIDLAVQEQKKNLELMKQIGFKENHLFKLVIAQNVFFTSVASLLGVLTGIFVAAYFGKKFGNSLGQGLIFKGFTDIDFAFPNLFFYWSLGLVSGVLATLIIFLKSNFSWRKKNKTHTFSGNFFSFWIQLGIVTILFGFAALISNAEPIFGVAVGAYLGIFLLLLTPILFLPSMIPGLIKIFSKLITFFGSKKGWLMLAFYRLSSENKLDSNVIRSILASLSLTVAMIIMVGSFRDSLTTWLDKVLESDCYLSIDADHAIIETDRIYKILENNEVVQNVEIVRVSNIFFNSNYFPVPVFLKRFSYGESFSVLPMVDTSPDSVTVFNQRQNSPGLIYLFASEGFLARYKLKIYDTFDLNFEEGVFKAFVLGKYRDYGRQHGSITISTTEYPELSEFGKISHYAINLKKGKKTQELKTIFESEIDWPIAYKISDNKMIKELSLIVFDKTFSITYLLFLVSLFVCIFSVACSCSSQIQSREQEFKLMKSIGNDTGVIFKQMLSEQTIVGLISILFAVLVGVLISVLLISKVNPQTFFWTLDFKFPLTDILVIALLAFASILSSTFMYFTAFKRQNLY